MPAYNPPPQVLFSPVSNYYQGKAIRAGLEEQKVDTEIKRKQSELLTQEIADAPSKREAARQAALLQTENIQSQIDKRTRDGDIAELELAAKAMTPLLEDYSNEPDEDKALAAFNENLPLALSMLSEKEQQRVIEAAGPDHVFSHDEVMRTGLGVRMFTDKQEGGEELTRLQARLADPNLRPEDRPAIEARIAKLTAPALGATEYDVGRDPRTPSQAGADYQANLAIVNTSSEIQEMISNALPEVLDLPGTVGATGKIAIGGAGLLTTIGQDELGEVFAEYVAGADSETIAAMQTQLQAIRGRIIPLVTGEQGKRLSEMEREIASRAVGLIDQIQRPADLTKSYPQVVGALKQLYEESWATRYRIAQNDANIQYPYDLSNRDELIELITEFELAGVDEKSIRRATTRLRAIQSK